MNPPGKRCAHPAQWHALMYYASACQLDALQAAQCGVNAYTQALDHTSPCDCNSLKARNMVRVEVLFKHRDGQGIMQVPLVPLYNQGEIGDILVHTPELLLEFVPALDILLQLACLGIDNKNHAVNAFENRDTCLLVQYLAWDSIELEANLEAVNFAEFKGKQIEVQSSLGLRVD